MSNNYDKENIAIMEMIYGEGYLSAGGDDEIAKICESIDVENKTVLDYGCGLGGASVTLARDLKAAEVTGSDIDEGVLVRANELVQRYQLQDRIKLIHVEPGPLPFDENSFDIVHITAVSCHFLDLDILFKDIFRVLKPGGNVVGRDWFKISSNDEFIRWDDLLRDRGLNFYFATKDQFSKSLRDSGFLESTMTNRTASISAMADESVHRVKFRLKSELVSLLGEAGYQDCLNWTQIRAKALSQNGIGQYQFVARKSARSATDGK